jgi:penicillin-binding protein 1A
MEKLSLQQRKYLKWFFIVFFSPWALLCLLILLASIGLLGFMPTFEDLENPKSNLASEVISTDGELLGKYYIQNRTFVEFEELSPHLVNALIAREDRRFTKHSGVDMFGLARVLVKTIMMGESGSGGGSTITQQLAKNLFPRDTVSNDSWSASRIKLFSAKLREWITAVKLERNYTKEEILVMYLNTVPFGSETFGVKSAAKTFFNKSPNELKIEEAALLIGMLKGPTKFNPVRNPERSLQRRNSVLEKMKDYDFITKEQYDSLLQLPIKLNYKLQDHNQGLATYFREYLRIMLTADKPLRKNYFDHAQYKEDSLAWENNPLYGWCSKNFKPDGSKYNLYRDGLKIYSTVDSRMQEYAEEAVTEHLGKQLQPDFFKEKRNRKKAPFSGDLKDSDIESIMVSAMKRTDRYKELMKEGLSREEIMKNFKTPIKMSVFHWKGDRDTVMSPWDSIRYYKFYLRAGLMSMDPKTGEVRAYVGGPDFRHFKYDAVKMQKRQVGSTFKPFLYTLAMQEGYTPCTLVPNNPVTFFLPDNEWTPKNAGKTKKDGQMVTLQWGLANSVNNISAWVMKQFNPESVVDVAHRMGIRSFLDPVPSLVLGTSDISLYEMVDAYCTFANKGVQTDPLMVTKIEDRNGNILATFKAPSAEAISAQTAYLMLYMMKGVSTYGTATRLRYRYHFTNPIGAKTGTTQNHSDGWFMGLTPDLVTGVWVGGEDRGIHFDELSKGQGASMALPIWALYMKKVLADPKIRISQGDFERPVNLSVSFNCADQGSGKVESEAPEEELQE